MVVVEVAIGLDTEMHHEGRGEVGVWSGSVWAVVVVVELGWTAGQVCGPGSCGEESGLPRLASLAGASCPQWLCLARFLLAAGCEGGKLHAMMRLCSGGVGEELLQ